MHYKLIQTNYGWAVIICRPGDESIFKDGMKRHEAKKLMKSLKDGSFYENLARSNSRSKEASRKVQTGTSSDSMFDRFTDSQPKS